MSGASVITSLRLASRALPKLLAMALPWLSLAMIIGLAGALSDNPMLGWQISRAVISLGACAMLLCCARTLYAQTELPYLALPDRAFFIYLVGWIPLAGVSYLCGLGGPWIAGLFAVCLFGRLSLLPLARALSTPTLGPWAWTAILRASVGTVGTFLLLPAICLLLLIPVVGGIAATGADVSFLEADLPSQGGALSTTGLASELLAGFLPLLAAATVGFYQGSLLREWQSQAAG